MALYLIETTFNDTQHVFVRQTLIKLLKKQGFLCYLVYDVDVV